MDSAADDSSSSNGSDGDDDGVQLPVFEEEAKPKKTETEIVTRCCTKRSARKILWESDYFYIPEAPPESTGLRIFVRSTAMTAGIGDKNLSKHLTPSHFGETPESCTVTMLLLRAWSIWRAHRDAWASARTCRKRQIDEDLSLLQRDVQKVLTQNGGSFGHTKADVVWAQFQEECPELAQ